MSGWLTFEAVSSSESKEYSLSPKLNQELKLSACIGDFLKVKRIDLLASEDALMGLDSRAQA